MTDTLILPPTRRFTPSSSRWVEELAGPSGLRPQASIAGCLSSWGQPDEWRASLERLGQERSRVGELQPHIPAPLEQPLFEGLAAAFLDSFWMGEVGHPYRSRDCVFLTAAHHGSGVVSARGQVYLVRLKRTGPTDWEANTPEEPVPETWEPVVPDTDQAYTIQQMAQAWKAIGRPITQDDVPLSVDPDDYPLF